MRLHKLLTFGMTLVISATTITASAAETITEVTTPIETKTSSEDENINLLTAAESSLTKTIVFQTQLSDKGIISGKLLFKNSILKTPKFEKIEKEYFPELSEPTQNPCMRAALRNEKVKEKVNELRNDCKKINDKYNQALLLSAESPTDTNLQEMTKELYSYDEKAKKIEDKVDKLLESNLDGMTDEITKTVISLLNEYQSKLKPIFIQASLVNLTSDAFNGITDVTEAEKQIVNTAMSLVGKIPYQWGGKAANGGWNKRWDKEGNGMDCSGFVEWVYWTIKGHSNEGLRSTIIIASRQKQISHEELRVGDLGMKYPTGTRYGDYAGKLFFSEGAAKNSNKAAGVPEDEITYLYNHVGIYVGKDMNGNDLWVHCTGDPISTVTVGTYEDFVEYYEMPN